MTLDEMFEQLLEAKELQVVFIDRYKMETLRTGMQRKLRAYKDLWDNAGFASADMMNLGLSCKLSKDKDFIIFTLKQQMRKANEYQILENVSGS